QLALRTVSTSRFREDAHQEVIRLYLAAGKQDAAVRQYAELERILRREDGTAPDADLRTLVCQRRPRSQPPELPVVEERSASSTATFPAIRQDSELQLD